MLRCRSLPKTFVFSSSPTRSVSLKLEASPSKRAAFSIRTSRLPPVIFETDSAAAESWVGEVTSPCRM